MRILDAQIRSLVWPWWRLLIITWFVAIPCSTGYWFWYLVGVNIHDRLQPMRVPMVQSVAYEHELVVFDSTTEVLLRDMQRKIVDSIEILIPVTYDHMLSPYELRVHVTQGTNLTAYLMHCRLWCNCREDLPAGSFQLMIFQLNPHASSYALVADTVMTYADYAKPFTFQLP